MIFNMHYSLKCSRNLAMTEFSHDSYIFLHFAAWTKMLRIILHYVLQMTERAVHHEHISWNDSTPTPGSD